MLARLPRLMPGQKRELDLTNPKLPQQVQKCSSMSIENWLKKPAILSKESFWPCEGGITKMPYFVDQRMNKLKPFSTVNIR